MSIDNPTHPDAPRADGETPAMTETQVDNLLREFQRACEMVVVEGDSNLSRTTKLRAILRNQLRAALLARHRDGELWDIAEAAWGVIANASEGDWSQEPKYWQEAAARWRDRYHAALRSSSTPPATLPAAGPHG